MGATLPPWRSAVQNEQFAAALNANVCVSCAPTPRKWSGLQQRVAPREAEGRCSSRYANAREAQRNAIAPDTFADGASTPGGVSGNAWKPGAGL